MKNTSLKYYRESGNYDVYQLVELENGIKEGLDCSKFDNPRFNFEKMRYIKLCIKKGFYIDLLSSVSVSPSNTKEYYLGRCNDIDLSEFIEDYNVDQLKEIKLALSRGIDLTNLINPKMSNTEIFHVRRILGLNISIKDENMKVIVESGLLSEPKLNFKTLSNLLMHMDKYNLKIVVGDSEEE